ncbi:alpha/beta hydrolase [Aliiroseovarius crassostreae]|uniref:alpha/beta hydrolase n=1 Tax=Aliiroseovarius crassostreae TaxID=154981 RepID=UPI003C7DC5A9
MSDERKTADDSAQAVSNLDLEIVSDTFRSIVDQDAFDKLILNWNQKLNALETADGSWGNRFASAFIAQLDAAGDTLDRLDVSDHSDPLERIVSEVAGPAIVLSPDLRVASINVEGINSFGTNTGAFFCEDRVDPASRKMFDAVVRAANQRGNAAQSVIHIIDQGQDDAAFPAEIFLSWLPNQPKPYIAIRTLELAWSSATSNRLKQAFDLTDAEVEVGRQFFQLCDLTLVAEKRGVSRHTVRTQMKTIMSKTGASSQADLIRLFAMVASRQLLETKGLRSTWRDPLDREKIIVTPEGRKIAWTWMGDPKGTPVIFLRGMAMGYLLPAQAEGLLTKARIKLLIPSRPGYGNSSLHEDLSPLEDNRTLLHDFMTALELKTCVGVGLSDGIIPILAEQDLHPDRFCALVSVGFNGCLNRAAFRKLPVPQATLLRLGKYAPDLLELIAKLGFRMMQKHGLDWYLERAHASTPLDLQTCRSPETATLVRDACAHLAVQGTRPFVRDMQMFHAPVDEAIDRLTIPMCSLVPTEDGLFDLREYQALETRNPNITVIPVENTADLLIYQQTEFILNHIIKTVDQDR